jgi:GMP synthase (glutamine-hydrolysing)
MTPYLLILKTGDTFADMARELGDFEDWIRRGLQDPQREVRVIDARSATELPALDELSGVLITGSHDMVSHRAPWSEALARWLAQAVRADVPVLGICYGHQLLAHAMGGEVDDHPRGLEVGTVPICLDELAQDDPLLGGLPVTFLGQMVHQQSVRRLPPGAVRLAHSAHEPHAAFRVGRRAWGVQFHPEFSPSAMCGYIAHLDDALRRQGADPKAMREAVKATDWAAALLVRFGRLSARRATVA